MVLALPRGGVPVGFEVATSLRCPLDVLVARKIGAPGNPELGIGAVAEGGVRVLNDEALLSLLVSEQELEHGVSRAESELHERVRLYRGETQPIPLAGRTAIVVDDGLATGGTARAAVKAARARGASRVILAVPVGARSTVSSLREEADEVICLLEPEPMFAIGMWYEDFAQVPDIEVLGLLGAAGEWTGEAWQAVEPGGETAHGEGQSADSREVAIPFGEGGSALGDLTVPEGRSCLVLFAHGSGSSRRSPRNRQVAMSLNERGVATLLFDLLTPEEELARANVFDIRLLARRLQDATRWAVAEPSLKGLKIGYFGASTGAAAALVAAAEMREEVSAVVSRGGRPDLAAQRLGDVAAPVLLIVGGADTVVLDLNRQALAQLRCPAKLEVVPDATHLFEEPGALAEVARLAGEWFLRHLSGS